MDEREIEVRRIINGYYDFAQIIKRFTGIERVADTLICPFHNHATRRNSAKIYRDLDGDRLYCFTEVKQYRVADYLLLQGEVLEKWVPEGVVVPVPEGRKEFEFSSLDGFKKGKFDIREFCVRLLNLPLKEK